MQRQESTLVENTGKLFVADYSQSIIFLEGKEGEECLTHPNPNLKRDMSVERLQLLPVAEEKKNNAGMNHFWRKVNRENGVVGTFPDVWVARGLLDRQELIPKEFEGELILFFGTVKLIGVNYYVPCIHKNGIWRMDYRGMNQSPDERTKAAFFGFSKIHEAPSC